LSVIADSGAGLPTIPRILAEDLGIPIPDKSSLISLPTNTSAGAFEQRVRAGSITVRIPGLDGTFTWPCHFVEPPHAPYMSLLGFGGVLNDLHIAFDGTYTLEAPYGNMVMRKQ
jgi:hypothetical protein